MQNAVDTTLAMTFDNVRFAQGQLKKADKVIERQLQAIPQTLTTIPGMGPVLGAGIIAEIGDSSKYTSCSGKGSWSYLDSPSVGYV